MTAAEMQRLTKGLPSKAAKIRALAAAGVSRADIARFLDIRYQHVRNVLTGAQPRSEAGPGFREETPPKFEEKPRPLVLGDGSVVIPSSIAQMLAVAPGGRLVAVEEDGGLWIGSRPAGVRHAQAIVRAVVPESESLVDDLLKSRREEVQRENDRWGKP